MAKKRPIITQPSTVKPIALAVHQRRAARVKKATPPTSPTAPLIPPIKAPR